MVWGAYHAMLFMPLILMGKNRRFTDTVAANRILPTWRETGQMLLTFFLVVIGWIIFRAESITQAWEYLGGMCDWSILTLPIRKKFSLRLLVLILVMLTVEWMQRNKMHGLAFNGTPAWLRWACYVMIFLILLIFGGQVETFIYFQF